MNTVVSIQTRVDVVFSEFTSETHDTIGNRRTYRAAIRGHNASVSLSPVPRCARGPGPRPWRIWHGPLGGWARPRARPTGARVMVIKSMRRSVEIRAAMSDERAACHMVQRGSLRRLATRGAPPRITPPPRVRLPAIPFIARISTIVGNAAPPRHQSRSAPRTGNRYNCRGSQPTGVGRGTWCQT